MTSRLTISLGALAQNYSLIQSGVEGEVAVVVKADAYGLGALPIGRALEKAGCKHFFVATAAEGVQLRETLPHSAIYVFEGATSSAMTSITSNQLTPVLNSLAQCRRWLQTEKPAALHVDTGMHRLGLTTEELEDIPSELQLELMVSHFARADEPSNQTNLEQIQRAESALESLDKRWPGIELSLGNSAGLLHQLCPTYMGRAGVGLYGGNPFVQLKNPLAPVVRFEAEVLQLRSVPADQPIGYGGTFVTDRPTRLAIIGAGYADGVPRVLSNQGSVSISGIKCPIIGAVSMDCVHVDVTELSEALVSEGDWAEIVGTTVLLDDVAAAAHTISYEILTGLGRRAEKHYCDELL